MINCCDQALNNKQANKPTHKIKMEPAGHQRLDIRWVMSSDMAGRKVEKRVETKKLGDSH